VVSIQIEPVRYELKIRCPSLYRPQIEAWVRTHWAHWRVRYPPRQVNNIYFDTLDSQNVEDNLDGVGERRKLRLRWYGPSLERVTDARLERKCREGAVGWKEIWPVEVDLDLTRQAWPEICARLRVAVDPRMAIYFTAAAAPTLINCYHRAYYATPDEAVRLTIDSDLRAYDQRFSARPNLSRAVRMPDWVIVELKAAAEYLPRLADILADFPFRPDRCSKYVSGVVSALDPDGVWLL
jgi:hypothetical protein